MTNNEQRGEQVSRKEAERRGAFAETALSESDALDSLDDEAEGEELNAN